MPGARQILHAVIFAMLFVLFTLPPAARAAAIQHDEEGNVTTGTAHAKFRPRTAGVRRALTGNDIGIDALHGVTDDVDFATGARYDQFRLEVTSHGLNMIHLTHFTSSDLQGLKAVLIKLPTLVADIYTPEEIAALHAFVDAGHGILAMTDGGYETDQTVANYNQFLAPYGIAVAAQANGNSYTISGFVDHPLTRGLVQIGTGFKRALTVHSPGLDLTVGGGDDDILACADGQNGRGNVVVLGDCSMFNDPDFYSGRPITFGDNTLLLRRILTYISGPSTVPVQMSSFSAD